MPGPRSCTDPLLRACFCLRGPWCTDVLQVEKRIQEERARVRTYLNIVTGPRLRAIVEKILIEEKAETLVNVRLAWCVVDP